MSTIAMPWSSTAKKQAIVLIGIVVPALMFGLGIAGYLVARAFGLGDSSIWFALAMSTVGLILSMVLTLKVGKAYEGDPAKKR